MSTITLNWLTEKFQEKSGKPEFNLQANFFEQELIDSFDIIVLIEDIEQHFSISFTDEDFQNRSFATIAGLADIIDQKVQ